VYFWIESPKYEHFSGAIGIKRSILPGTCGVVSSVHQSKLTQGLCVNKGAQALSGAMETVVLALLQMATELQSSAGWD
jgi:hypothetical protein